MNTYSAFTHPTRIEICAKIGGGTFDINHGVEQVLFYMNDDCTDDDVIARAKKLLADKSPNSPDLRLIHQNSPVYCGGNQYWKVERVVYKA